MFKRILRYRRCLVAADGWFEWRATPAGKQKWFMRLRDGEPFAFAGLWDRWDYQEDIDHANGVESFTLITTTPNQTCARIHDRMPVIIRPEHYQAWLSPDITEVKDVQAMIATWPAERTEAWQVRTKTPMGTDSAEFIEPVGAGGEAELSGRAE